MFLSPHLADDRNLTDLCNSLYDNIMSFWKFLGWAWLLDKLFGDNRHQHNNICPPGNHSEYDTYDDNRYDDNRYDDLSDRIDEMEGRLDELDSDSDQYDDLEEKIELMREELDDMDDDRLGFNGYNGYNDYNDDYNDFDDFDRY